MRLTLIATGLALALRLVWRPLVLATFDQVFAQTMGIPVGLVCAGLTSATALAAVVAFQAVGPVLTITMLICPDASARLLPCTLPVQLIASLAFAEAAAILGYFIAGYAPLWVGLPFTLSASGMIATVPGLMLTTSALIASHRVRTAL